MGVEEVPESKIDFQPLKGEHINVAVHHSLVEISTKM